MIDNENNFNHLYLELDQNNIVNNLVEDRIDVSLLSDTLSNRIKFAIRESIVLNILLLLISISKLSFTSYLFIAKSDESCQGSMRIWIISMFSYDIINILSVILIIHEIRISYTRLQNTLDNSLDNSFRNFDLTFHSQIRRRMGHENSLNGYDVNHNIERHYRCTSYLLEFGRFVYLLLFLFGNVIFFSESGCPKGIILYI